MNKIFSIFILLLLSSSMLVAQKDIKEIGTVLYNKSEKNVNSNAHIDDIPILEIVTEIPSLSYSKTKQIIAKNATNSRVKREIIFPIISVDLILGIGILDMMAVEEHMPGLGLLTHIIMHIVMLNPVVVHIIIQIIFMSIWSVEM